MLVLDFLSVGALRKGSMWRKNHRTSLSCTALSINRLNWGIAAVPVPDKKLARFILFDKNVFRQIYLAFHLLTIATASGFPVALFIFPYFCTFATDGAARIFPTTLCHCVIQTQGRVAPDSTFYRLCNSAAAIKIGDIWSCVSALKRAAEEERASNGDFVRPKFVDTFLTKNHLRPMQKVLILVFLEEIDGCQLKKKRKQTSCHNFLTILTFIGRWLGDYFARDFAEKKLILAPRFEPSACHLFTWTSAILTASLHSWSI